MAITSHTTPLTPDILIRHIAGQFNYSLPGCLEHCDLIQTGWVAFLEAQQRHQPERGSLWAFAYLRIRGAMLDAIRAAFKQTPQRQETVAEDGDDLLDAIPDPNPAPDECLIKEENARLMLAGAYGSKRKTVLQLYQAGWQQREIARHLQLSEGRVSQHLAEIRNQLAFGESHEQRHLRV